MNPNIHSLMRTLQFSDSALPVGTFSFSNGLETAAHTGVVHDARTLEEYTHTIALQAAYTDGVAALHAHRAAKRDDYKAVLATDRFLMECKLNEETRQMLRRMGRKLAELGIELFHSALLYQWLEDIKAGEAPGTYPVAQGLTFAEAGLGEEALYTSHQYGTISMVLNAALRCVKVSHFDTQCILYRLAGESLLWFPEVRELELEDMNAFMPLTDILASLHEKGAMRMFMN